jgi:DNA-binding MarR family transcriptional regulator
MQELGRQSGHAGAPEAAPPYVLEKQIGHLLRRAHQRASAIFAERIGEDHLTPLQYAALVKVQDCGSVTQNRLGRLTAMDPATIRGVVRRLRDRRLIARRADLAHRRRIVWRLTAAGAAVVARTVPRGRRISAQTLEPLSPQEQSVFLSLLERIGEADGAS